MSAPDEGEGTGDDFKTAAENAWKDAKENKHLQPGWFDVKKIEVRTENPIREYKVTIKKQ